MAEENNLPPELIEALKELTEVVRENAQALKGTVPNIEAQIKANKELAASTRDVSKAQKEQQEQLAEHERILEAKDKAEKERLKAEFQYKEAVDYTQRSLKSFAGALFSTEQSMGKYGESLTGAGEAAWQLGKAFGLGGAALGGLVKGATMLLAANLKQMDAILKANDELAKIGGAGGRTGEELLKMAHGAGLTSKNLELLVKPIKSLGSSLRSFGGDVDTGIAAMGELAKVTSTQRGNLQRLGISQEDLIQSQADYIALQVASGRNLKSDMADRVKLQQASLEYTENLMVLAKISGEEVGGIKQKQREASEELQWQLKQYDTERKIQDAKARKDDAEVARLEKMRDGMQKSLDYFAAFNDPNLTKGMRQLMSTDGLLAGGPEAVKLARMGLTEAAKEMQKNIEAGADAEMESAKFRKKYLDQVRETAKKENIGAAGAFGEEGKKLADEFGLTSQALKQALQGYDPVKELEDARKKVKKGQEPGKDPMQDARTKMLETERAAQKALDKLVSAFGFTTIAGLALAAAASAAALKLTLLAKGSGLGGPGGGILDTIKDYIGKKGGPKAAAGEAWKATAAAVTGGIDKLREIYTTKGGMKGISVEAWKTSTEMFKTGRDTAKAGLDTLKGAIEARGGMDKILMSAGKTIAGGAVKAGTILKEGAVSAGSIIAKAATSAFDLAKSGMGSLTDLIKSRGGIGKVAGSAASTIGSSLTTGKAALGALGGAARFMPVAGAVVAGATAAYGAYSEYQDVKEKEKTGQISKEEASKKKTEAVGGGVGATAGAAGGAWAGAAAGAAIGSAIPVVGTIIGGVVGMAVGGWLGSKGGDVVGRTAAKGINAMKDSADKKTDEAVKKIEANKIESKEHSAMNKGTFAGVAAGALLGPIGMIVGGVIGNKLNKNAKEKEVRKKEADELLLTKPQDKDFKEPIDLKDTKDLPGKSMFDGLGKMLIGGIPLFGAAFTAYDKIKDVDIKGKMSEVGTSIVEGLDSTKEKITKVGELIGSKFIEGVDDTKAKVSKAGEFIGSTMLKGLELSPFGAAFKAMGAAKEYFGLGKKDVTGDKEAQSVKALGAQLESLKNLRGDTGKETLGDVDEGHEKKLAEFQQKYNEGIAKLSQKGYSTAFLKDEKSGFEKDFDKFKSLFGRSEKQTQQKDLVNLAGKYSDEDGEETATTAAATPAIPPSWKLLSTGFDDFGLTAKALKASLGNQTKDTNKEDIVKSVLSIISMGSIMGAMGAGASKLIGSLFSKSTGTAEKTGITKDSLLDANINTKDNLLKVKQGGGDEEESPLKTFEDVLRSANISLRGLVISFTKWDKLLKESIEKEEQLLKDSSKKGFLAKLAERLPGQQKTPGQPGAAAAPAGPGGGGAASPGGGGAASPGGGGAAAPAGPGGGGSGAATAGPSGAPSMAAAATGPDGKPAEKDPDAAAQQGAAGPGKEKKELTTTKPKNITVQQTADVSGVDSSLLSAFYTAAEEYGKHVSINSAYRGDKKQAELWVRGRILNEPGIYTPAAPKNDTTIDYKGQTYNVKGSGRGSSHGDGNALDVTADWGEFDPILRKYGLHRPYASNDPPHIEKIKAKEGGIASGPESGYPATLHGREMIVPLEPNSILEKISKSTASTSESIQSILSPSAAKDNGADNMIKEMVNANVEMYNLLSEKLDRMIDTLGEGNDTSKKLLKRQMI